jgi:hypothetical protein
MIQGLRTVVYHVEDLAGAKEWYSSVLGKKPYFDEAFYVGFNVGGYELGLDPDMENVANIEEAYAKLVETGAEIESEITDVGGGIKVAAVRDPSGNIFGIIENPHFKIEE